MVNKFGMMDCAGLPGPVGPRGPAGASGFNDLVRWFPEMMLKEIRSSEFCCLKIDNPISDLVIEDKTFKILKWNSLLTKKKTNAVAVEDFSSKEYIKVKEGIYALKFNGQTLYRLEDIMLSPSEWVKQWVWVCTTFRPSIDISENDQCFIYSNKDRHDKMFRGLSLSKTSIKIWGCENESDNFILIDIGDRIAGKWITVYTFWTNLDKGKGYYTICIDDTKLNGEFICQKSSEIFVRDDVDIGGCRYESKVIDGFKGDISSFELYNNNHIKDLTQLKFPDILKDLMIENQKSRVSTDVSLCQKLTQEEFTKPPAPKRKKVT